jgi:hypothetical protein
MVQRKKLKRLVMLKMKGLTLSAPLEQNFLLFRLYRRLPGYYIVLPVECS